MTWKVQLKIHIESPLMLPWNELLWLPHDRRAAVGGREQTELERCGDPISGFEMWSPHEKGIANWEPLLWIQLTPKPLVRCPILQPWYYQRVPNTLIPVTACVKPNVGCNSVHHAEKALQRCCHFRWSLQGKRLQEMPFKTEKSCFICHKERKMI